MFLPLEFDSNLPVPISTVTLDDGVVGRALEDHSGAVGGGE